jgi:hypothetical protein
MVGCYESVCDGKCARVRAGAQLHTVGHGSGASVSVARASPDRLELLSGDRGRVELVVTIDLI